MTYFFSALLGAFLMLGIPALLTWACACIGATLVVWARVRLHHARALLSPERLEAVRRGTYVRTPQ